MKNRSVLLSFLIVIVVGCTHTNVRIYRAVGPPSICYDTNVHLGNIAILPESAWRKNQKEPEKREKMALEVIKQAFEKFPCGKTISPGGVRNFSSWSKQSESSLIKRFSPEGVDTILLLRIEELTPNFMFTFSLPFLWGASNEVDFRLKILSVKTGEVLADTRIHRITGGPFQIRPAEWSRKELSSALRSMIQ